MSADFSIVIPVYNEIASLHKLFDLLAKIDSEANQGMEIVFVSDGSTDGSDGMIEEWETRFLRKRYIRHDINFGYGAALGTGINAASGKWVVTMVHMMR